MIKLHSITKTLKQKTVLQDVNFTFEPGKIYLLKGHNGSGKTMLLRVLANLLHPSAGTIERPNYTYGVMIENPSFVEHETARSNLKFLASIRKTITMATIEETLQKVNLLEQIDVKVKHYSLGMKQRLAFCQAIMENPDVLLLDEPFNALDDENLAVMVQLLQQLRPDKIIVIAAHGIHLSDIPIFDEVITMNGGKIKQVEVLCH